MTKADGDTGGLGTTLLWDSVNAIDKAHTLQRHWEAKTQLRAHRREAKRESKRLSTEPDATAAEPCPTSPATHAANVLQQSNLLAAADDADCASPAKPFDVHAAYVAAVPALLPPDSDDEPCELPAHAAAELPSPPLQRSSPSKHEPGAQQPLEPDTFPSRVRKQPPRAVTPTRITKTPSAPAKVVSRRPSGKIPTVLRKAPARSCLRPLFADSVPRQRAKRVEFGDVSTVRYIKDEQTQKKYNVFWGAIQAKMREAYRQQKERRKTSGQVDWWWHWKSEFDAEEDKFVAPRVWDFVFERPLKP
eukprot:NODE_2312_length_1090_cov_41.574247_g2294_i0.p1 GENE.NODE_2312_length_1090_cov_41.574247_g2294_i0~~NODE_2312_length_1090_cov_41.574247_g2294_i0.p1  ORF type:complete len:330 (+),score=59.97 NODE_2312_length_1090_cov_41.574247_g2294_i0:79-990(+)